MSNIPQVIPDSPILILAPRLGPTRGSGPVILGLSLGERARLAARRAGFATTIELGEISATPPATASTLLIAANDLLAEVNWLKAAAAISLTQWAAIGDRLILIPAPQAADGLAALPSGDADMNKILEALTQRLGPPASLPPGIDPTVVTSPADHPAAERRLLRALVKDTDGFMARHFDRPISLAVSRRLAATSITPNQMTLISVVIGLIGAPFFLSAQPLWQTVGALLFLAHSVLDGCDGELARLKFKESRWGGVLDFWGDNVVHSAIFACIGIGWSWSSGSGWPLVLGIAAVFGTLGSASLVYWRTMRPKKGIGPLYTSVAKEPGKRFSQVLDAVSRRDFIYGVVVLALFGWVKYFLLLSAIGAPTFFFALVYLAIRERRG
jgi:phosphatidylglycerophosphate synthase